eukprot:8786467-Pyramimonas_sp.AAC.1
MEIRRRSRNAARERRNVYTWWRQDLQHHQHDTYRCWSDFPHKWLYVDCNDCDYIWLDNNSGRTI